MSIEPQKSTDVTKVLQIITNEDKMEILFKKIAQYGHNKENIRHAHLGRKNDTLCLPEILLFASKGQDAIFSFMCVDPLSILKEAFYYAVSVNTLNTDEIERIVMRKDMSLLTFFNFMENLFMFSRLWQIFVAADDGIEDEFISREEFCRAKGKLESMGGVKMYRDLTDAQWAKGFSYIDDSKDEQIEFSEFIHFCVRFIITPEEYLIKAVAVCGVKRKSIYEVSPEDMTPLLRATGKQHSSFMSQASFEEGNESDEEESAEQFEKDLDLKKREDDESFEAYLKEVKLTHGQYCKGFSREIVRSLSDLSSTHGSGNRPSAADLIMLQERSSADATKMSIERWNQKQIATRQSSSGLFSAESIENGKDGYLNLDSVQGDQDREEEVRIDLASRREESAALLHSGVGVQQENRDRDSDGRKFASRNFSTFSNYSFEHLPPPKILEPVEKFSSLQEFMQTRERRRSYMQEEAVVSSLFCQVHRQLSTGPLEGDRCQAVRNQGAVVGLPRVLSRESIAKDSQWDSRVCPATSPKKSFSFDDEVSDGGAEEVGAIVCGAASHGHCSSISLRGSHPDSHLDNHAASPFDSQVDVSGVISRLGGHGSTVPITSSANAEYDSGGMETRDNDDDQSKKIDVIALIEHLILAQFETPETRKRH